MNYRTSILCAIAAIGLASVAQAQTQSISGVVRDSATGRPLAGAVVELRRDTIRRSAQTDDEGEFRLGDLFRGDYRLAVRRLGYGARASTLEIGASDLTLNVTLIPIARDLDTLYVRAGTGIYGVVGSNEGLRPLASAKIQVLGENRFKVTDSSGTFFIPLERGGTYVVRMTRKGYEPRMFPIAVRSGRAEDVSRLLDSTTKNLDGLEVLFQDFDQRLRWRGMNSVLLTGSEVRRGGSVELTPSFNARGLVLGSSICVFLNGTPRPGMNLDVVPLEKIEVMELYGASDVAARELHAKWPARSVCGFMNRGRRYVATSGPRRNAIAQFAVIWLKPE